MKYLLFHLGLYELHEVSNVVFSCRSAGDFPGRGHLIALVLALSNGIQLFIDKVQEDTLSSYPIAIESSTY